MNCRTVLGGHLETRWGFFFSRFISASTIVQWIGVQFEITEYKVIRNMSMLVMLDTNMYLRILGQAKCQDR